MDTAFFTLADCYIAYRKAKSEAYYENSYLQALAFAHYEQRLNENIGQLHRTLLSSNGSWAQDKSWLGTFAYTPKSVAPPSETSNDGLFYRCIDPLEEWRRLSKLQDGNRLAANFRLMIKPSVNFQVISALWIMKVGHIFDAAVDNKLSYGNRLRRQPLSDEWLYPAQPRGSLNLDCPSLFKPYFSAYRQWRENGLTAMRLAVEQGQRVVAITMDLSKFYHRVNPRFALRKSFLQAIGVDLSPQQTTFTSHLLNAIDTWYQSTPDALNYPNGALPVGLSASKILSNVLLAEFDRGFVANVNPLYYGRYVDDFFIVLMPEVDVQSGMDLMEYLSAANPGILSRIDTSDGHSGLKLSLPYATDSELIFGGEKQKFFNLSGAYGLDLVTHIADQIRRQSSEHRLLPVLPSTGPEMASRALLAQPEATLEVDALRKADVISVRRLGFSLLLRDMESYARELPPRSWKPRRQEFYDLVQRHIITPQGFFEFFTRYVPRVFSLMVGCRDYKPAEDLVERLGEVLGIIKETTTAGTSGKNELESCIEYCGNDLIQAALRASTLPRFAFSKNLLRLFTCIRRLNPTLQPPKTLISARRQSEQIFHADFGLRPYREAWLNGASYKVKTPPLPRQRDVRRLILPGAIRAFQREAKLAVPHWPAITFPTRPINLSEITFHAPTLLHSPLRLRAALFAFRGARARQNAGFGLEGSKLGRGAPELLIHTKSHALPRIGLPSLYTSPEDWKDALSGNSNLRLERLERVRRLVNGMCRERPKPSYVVFPECSIPREWARGVAFKLAQQRISFIAGLEYRLTRQGVRNDAFISLTTEWPWYPASISYVQPKLAPSHDEKKALRANGGKKLYKPGSEIIPVYVHGNFCFGVLICSDLTTILNRAQLQGAVDALFVLEWNPDIETFDFLVQASAHDLHSYVIQVNNRIYGDSRIRAPRKIDYERDMVRVKGGLADYFVVAELDYESLRGFQRRPTAGNKAKFKPLPIGFAMSERRKAG